MKTTYQHTHRNVCRYVSNVCYIFTFYKHTFVMSRCKLKRNELQTLFLLNPYHICLLHIHHLKLGLRNDYKINDEIARSGWSLDGTGEELWLTYLPLLSHMNKNCCWHKLNDSPIHLIHYNLHYLGGLGWVFKLKSQRGFRFKDLLGGEWSVYRYANFWHCFVLISLCSSHYHKGKVWCLK